MTTIGQLRNTPVHIAATIAFAALAAPVHGSNSAISPVDEALSAVDFDLDAPDVAASTDWLAFAEPAVARSADSSPLHRLSCRLSAVPSHPRPLPLRKSRPR